MTARLLVVDDDASIRETFALHFRSRYEVSVAVDGTSALRDVGRFDPDLVITDVRMPGLSGLDVLEQIKVIRPETDVLVMTAHEDMASVIRAMKSGAYDYLVKPLDLDQVELVVKRCLRDRRERLRAARLQAQVAAPYALDQIVGRHASMISNYKLIGQVADTRTPVLVRGETGTGKELIARAIHFNSSCATEPFIALNCTAIAETLLESELFGHVRGSFTGAIADRRGRFEQAGRGTLFLDEIGDTSPAFQAKLLRVLQEHEFVPVGGEKVRRTEARVIAATNRDLEAMVRDGAFREDLYNRLRVMEIRVPPLRERREDIALLVTHFVGRMAAEMHLGPVSVNTLAMTALLAYDWPGNVRELENTLARAMVVASGGVIGTEHLSLGVGGSDHLRAAPVPEDDSLESMERMHVERVLRKTSGNKRQAAGRLGVSRPTLDRMIEKHGLASDVVKERDTDGQAT